MANRPVKSSSRRHAAAPAAHEEAAAHKAFVPLLLSEMLPVGQRNALPEEAQQLFVQAYNYGLEEYGDAERARHLGWASVHRHYDRVGNRWVLKAVQPEVAVEGGHPSGDDVAARLRHLHGRS